MSSTEIPTSTPTSKSTTGWFNRFDSLMERLGERLNPILVKEARQALKSQQFLTTFTFLLLFGWVWSVLGLVLMLPGVYYSPGGPFMLVGFFIILAVPLIIIVPFSTYRSLAAEREDGTFELLSITSLSSRHIITGKLGSAVLQMIVYYSALSPCIAFTYLLRGVDILTIVALLTYTFMMSLFLSVLGLLVATITRARHWQLMLSVVYLLVLAFVGVIWVVPFSAMLSERAGMPFDDPVFWTFNFGLVTFYLSYIVLFVLAAAGMISFASDNRSTRLRIMMLIQQALLVGWCMYAWVKADGEWRILVVQHTFSALHWVLMGALMSGEIAQLSPRVRRSLPQSFLGRMFFTWFNPGSGTGYLFASLNFLASVLIASLASLVGTNRGMGAASNLVTPFTYGMLAWGYVTLYLGITRPLIRFIQPHTRAGLLLPVLINLLVALLGCLLPLLVEGWANSFLEIQYSPLQISNWFWSLQQAAEQKTLDWTVFAGVLIAAVAVLIVNILMTYRDVEAERLAAPIRVLEDDRSQFKPSGAKPT